MNTVDLNLKGRGAIIAAASEGIGRATALALAKEGANVAICGRREAPLRAAADYISAAAGVRVFALAGDVTRQEFVRDFVARAAADLGAADICVTNAGGPPSKPFAETTPDDWRLAVDLNLLSTVWFAQEALPRMQSRGWGRFVAITSVAVKKPLAGLVLSNAVRSAVDGLVRSLSNEYAGCGITVNNVCPGYTATARLREIAAKSGGSAEERWAGQIPAGRLGRPEEIADAIAFLCSDRAAYISGESIAVDGGFASAYA